MAGIFDRERSVEPEKSWVFEEASSESREAGYDLVHTPCLSQNIEFCGTHLPGLDTIYLQGFDAAAFDGEDIEIGDEVIGFDREPLHPGTDAIHVKEMVVSALDKATEDNYPLIHLRRHVGGINAKRPDTHYNPNVIFHYAKEYPDMDDAVRTRPFVFAADKKLLDKAKDHLEQMITYHDIDNAQLVKKLNMLQPESGDVRKGKATSKATEAMRLAQMHTFMMKYVELMRDRKRYNTAILEINKSALHGVTHEKLKAELMEKLLVCEQDIVKMADLRIQQMRNYSDYDFRHELIALKAQKTKLVAEMDGRKAHLSKIDLVSRKKQAEKDILDLANLENYAIHDKYDMMEHIHRKELELDGIFEDDEYQMNDDERFPHASEFWHKVNRPGGL